MSLQIIAIGSDNLVRLDGLEQLSPQQVVNAATVTYTLTDANGNVVNGLSNVAMLKVPNFNGRYEGNIPNTTPLTLNALYTVAITAVAAYTLLRKVSCIAKYRSEW
jgi:hypothetical protein